MDQPRQIYDIGPFRSSVKNKDTQLNVHVSDKHFKIDIFEDDLKSSTAILEEYLRQVSRQEPEFIPEEDEGPFYEDTLDEMHEYTLEDCLFAEEPHYSMKAERNKLVPVFMWKYNGKENHMIRAQLPPSKNIDYSMFPLYSPHEIQVAIDENSTSLPAVPRQVYITGRGEPCFFKIAYAGDVGIALRELRAPAKIQSLEVGETVYNSRLHGLVRNDEGSIMGLLLSYIDCVGSTLSCVDVSDPRYSELPQKRFDQISRTLEVLHAHGIV